MIRGERMDQHSHGAQLRRMERRDLQAILDLINTEGWEYHISEMERILSVDPENSIVAFSGAEIVGGITVAVTGKRCILGHVIVKDGWRNKRIGQLMMDQLAEKLDSRGVETIEAYAVKAAVQFYKRHGYQTVEEIDTYDKILGETDVAGAHFGQEIRALSIRNFDEIFRFDRKVTGFDRPNVIRQILNEFPGMARSLYEGSELSGFLLSRVNPIMNDLGPWVMARPNPEDGVKMLSGTLALMKAGQRALAGVSANNVTVREIFLSLGFKAVNKQYRMMRSKGKMEPFRPGMMTIAAFEFG
jgi:predicted N-acetyltransferase YhbS